MVRDGNYPRHDAPCWRLLAMLCVVTAMALGPTLRAQESDLIEIRVTQDQAPIQVSKEILARVGQGERLQVLHTKGAWYWVQVDVDGRRVEGWILHSHVRPVEAPQPANEQREAPLIAEEKDLLEKAHALRDQADKLEEREEYAEMIPLNQEALEIRTQVLGPEHPDTAEAMWALGVSLDNDDKYDEALKTQLKALAIRRKVLGGEHPDTADSLHSLGWVEFDRDHAEAKKYFEQALAIRKKVLGLDHEDSATSLAALGVAQRVWGDYAGAKAHQEQALTIRQELLGNEHKDTAHSLHEMGHLYYLLGQYPAAKRNLQQALAIRRKELGDSTATATSLTILGRMLVTTSDLAEAKEYLDEALKINRKIHGEDDPVTGFTLADIGVLLTNMGDYKAARPYYEMADSRYRDRAFDERFLQEPGRWSDQE